MLYFKKVFPRKYIKLLMIKITSGIRQKDALILSSISTAFLKMRIIKFNVMYWGPETSERIA